MLEVRKNTFSKNYENSFFREFSRHLYKLFKEKNLNGVLIGSPLCEVDERLQIDALLITQSVVCIIDFKNFRGKITLPSEKNFEFGLWTTESGEQIRGGNSINPFIQLKNQRKRFYDVSKKSILINISKGDIFNPARVIRVVCFQNEIHLDGKIPGNEANTFFILDKANFLEGILDIIDVTDKEVSLTEASYNAFKNVFRADQFKFDDKPLEDKLKDVASKSPKLNYNSLYDDQKAALTEIKYFLESKEQQVFVLQGTINSGKSYLIPFIQDLAFNSAIQETEIFAASSRVAKNLLLASSLENVNSIYPFIYGGHKTETEEDEEIIEEIPTNNEEQDISDELALEAIPLKKCDNSENALFTVDESQLVSDSYYQSLDLVFGTGYLLRDLLEFSGQIDKQNKRVEDSKRKIIFIGDPYQLQRGKTDESPLNPAYLEENYKLKVGCFQLLDKENFSDINKQALSCVKSIKSKLYNSLRFIAGNQFSFLNKEDVLPYVSNLISNNIDGHILSFSNEESQKVNFWIKKSVIKTGEDIAPKDLVLLNNNISVEDQNDPFAQPKKINNGQFATVISVSSEPFLEVIKKIKGDLTKLHFRELTLRLNDKEHQVKVLSLENYRINPKAELSKNELILFKVLLNTELNKARNQNPFNKSKEYSSLSDNSVFKKVGGEKNDFILQLINGTSRRKDLNEEELHLKKFINGTKRNYRKRIEADLRKDPSTKYYKLKNAALLRFGWAMTVHKSMSYKWQEIVFNVDPGESVGKTNEHHFRWLYTGISRARQKVNLINYTPISPFDNTEFKDTNTKAKLKEILFFSENPNKDERLSEFEQFILNKTNSHHYKVEWQKHSQYQLLYTFEDSVSKKTVLSIYFKDNGRFNFPTIMNSNPKEFGETVLEVLKQKKPVKDFSFVKDAWRKFEYETLNHILSDYEINFEIIIQTKYKDKIRFYSHENELEIELDYLGDGIISFITARFYNDVSIWEDFKKAIESIKN